MTGFEQILVPVDYSEASDNALRIAANLARASKGRLLVVHFLRLDVYGMAEFPGILPNMMSTGLGEFDDERARLQQHVAEVLAGGEGPPPAYEVEVDWGSPYLQIVERAVDRGVDLIVMGTHGRTGVKHALLGSVAEKTVRLSPCPVLTVRPEVANRLGTATEATVPVECEHAHNGEVGRLMSEHPVTIGPDDMLAEACQRMRSAHARHLPVVDGAKLVGILSDRDLPAHYGQFERTRVHVAMTADPATVSADDSVDAAARLMLDRRVHAVPIVDGEKVVGVLSTSDILEDYARVARG